MNMKKKTPPRKSLHQLTKEKELVLDPDGVPNPLRFSPPGQAIPPPVLFTPQLLILFLPLSLQPPVHHPLPVVTQKRTSSSKPSKARTIWHKPSSNILQAHHHPPPTVI